MTNSHYFKFGIGFVAGLCAAKFPRLIATLATASESEVVALFNCVSKGSDTIDISEEFKTS